MRRVISHVQRELKTSELFARRIVQTVIGGIEEQLIAGNGVVVPGFGQFLLKRVGAKTIRNPQTGKPKRIKCGVCPAFRASDTLKSRVRAALVRKWNAGEGACVTPNALAVDSAPDGDTE